MYLSARTTDGKLLCIKLQYSKERKLPTFVFSNVIYLGIGNRLRVVT
jgi:hypothetical protein